MIEYKKILVPIDLTENSIKIIPHARSISDKFGAEIVLIFVAKVHEYYVDGEKPGEGIKKKVAKFLKENCPDFPESKVVIVDGDAAEEIIKYLEKENIDLIVMANRGRKALDKAIFGSVAADVARNLTAPVMFVNPFIDKFLH